MDMPSQNCTQSNDSLDLSNSSGYTFNVSEYLTTTTAAFDRNDTNDSDTSFTF
jgi:hypothetical protein